MVGGLIQQQHIGARDQCLRQCNAFAHAPRQRLHNSARIQLQPLQSFIQPLFPSPTLSGFDQALQRIQIATAVGVIVDPLHDIGQAFAHGLKNRVLWQQQGLLRHIGDAHTLLHVQRAIVRPLHPRQNFQQGRLACAVAANQANALRDFEREVSMIKECDMAKCQ